MIASRLRSIVCCGLLSLVLATAASGAEDSFAYDLAGELMSPYCPGRTVASCPSPQASELIQWISVQEAAGASRDEVVEMLIDRFGEEILGAPPAEGITLWAYVFPVVGFLGGGGAVWLVLRRIVGRGEGDEPGAAVGRTDPATSEDTEPAAGTPSAAQGTEDDALARLVDEELAGRR